MSIPPEGEFTTERNYRPFILIGRAVGGAGLVAVTLITAFSKPQKPIDMHPTNTVAPVLRHQVEQLQPLLESGNPVVEELFAYRDAAGSHYRFRSLLGQVATEPNMICTGDFVAFDKQVALVGAPDCVPDTSAMQ